MDFVNKETRSRMMSAVHSKDTKLETDIRRRLFAMGFRYRLHRRDLPGTPDLVFPKYAAVIFVHGCFWHSHGCERSKLPETRARWWKNKINSNRSRDKISIDKLRKMNLRVMIIWECSVRFPGKDRTEMLQTVAERASLFLQSEKALIQVPRFPHKRADIRAREKKNV